MPFIVRILAEDLDGWELYEHEVHRGPVHFEEQRQSRRPFHYRLKQDVYRSEFAVIKLDSPERLDMLIDHDLFCFISIEQGYLSRTLGDRPSVRFQLDRLREEIREPPRRLRISIASVDTSKNPPRVMLKEWSPT